MTFTRERQATHRKHRGISVVGRHQGQISALIARIDPNDTVRVSTPPLPRHHETSQPLPGAARAGAKTNPRTIRRGAKNNAQGDYRLHASIPRKAFNGAGVAGSTRVSRTEMRVTFPHERAHDRELTNWRRRPHTPECLSSCIGAVPSASELEGTVRLQPAPVMMHSWGLIVEPEPAAASSRSARVSRAPRLPHLPAPVLGTLGLYMQSSPPRTRTSTFRDARAVGGGSPQADHAEGCSASRGRHVDNVWVAWCRINPRQHPHCPVIPNRDSAHTVSHDCVNVNLVNPRGRSKSLNGLKSARHTSHGPFLPKPGIAGRSDLDLPCPAVDLGHTNPIDLRVVRRAVLKTECEHDPLSGDFETRVNQDIGRATWR